MPKRDNLHKSRLYLAAAAIVGGAAWATLQLFRRKPIEPITEGVIRGEGVSVRHLRRAHESFQLSVPGVAICFVACGMVALIMHAVLWDWLKHMPGGPSVDAETRWNPAAQSADSQGVAKLQMDPKGDWLLYQTTEQSNLNAAVAPTGGQRIGKLPIEVTMRRILESGPPQFQTNVGLSPLELQQRRAGPVRKGSQ